MEHASLQFTMNEAWDYLHRLLVGLSDHEFFWEPVPNCWRIYQTENGRCTYDYQIPAPDPSPLTTIGWRLVHLAACKVMYYEYAFGPAKRTFPDLTIPPTAVGAIAWLEHGHALLTAALANPQTQPCMAQRLAVCATSTVFSNHRARCQPPDARGDIRDERAANNPRDYRAHRARHAARSSGHGVAINCTTAGVAPRGRAVKDVLAHLTWWDQWLLVTLPADQARSDVPITLHLANQIPPTDRWADEMNDKVFAYNQPRELSSIQDEFTTTRNQLLQRVARLSTDDLFNPDGMAAMIAQPVAPLIYGIYEHYEEHAHELEQLGA